MSNYKPFKKEMTIEEANKILEEMNIYPEELKGESKRLFEAIMKIADGRDKAESDLYEANNRINDLLDLDTQKDKLIDEMVKVIIDSEICKKYIKNHCIHYAGENNKLCDECILEYFEERCK